MKRLSSAATSEPKFVTMMSRSTPGKEYRVYLSGVCECDGFRYSGKCHHIQQLRKILALTCERIPFLAGAGPEEE